MRHLKAYQLFENQSRFDSVVKDILLEVEDKGLVWNKETRDWRQGKDDDKNGYKAGQRYQFHSYMISNNFGGKEFYIDEDIINCINTLIEYMQEEGLKLQKISLQSRRTKPAELTTSQFAVVDYPVYWVEVRFTEPA